MKILYVGNYQHPFCTEVHLTRELESLGHEVDRFQEPPGGGDLRTLVDIENRAHFHKAQLVMWQRTWGLPDEATQLWRALEDDGITTASYHLDLYVGLDRAPRTQDDPLQIIDPFWTTQHVFSADGDPASQRWLEERGVNHHWMPAGVVSDACVPGTTDHRRFPHEIVFVGSAWENYHREWTHRRELLAFLERTYGERFHRWGGDSRRGPIREQALNDLYASAKVVVGDTYSPLLECETCAGIGAVVADAELGAEPGDVCADCDGQGQRRQRNYWSDRVYETIGRGGFLIHPLVPGLEAHFEWGQHLLGYDLFDFEMLRHSIDAAIEMDERRRTIAAAGQAHVIAHHTYRHRLQSALEVMGLA